jgi:hypothetical protein
MPSAVVETMARHGSGSDRRKAPRHAKRLAKWPKSDHFQARAEQAKAIRIAGVIAQGSPAPPGRNSVIRLECSNHSLNLKNVPLKSSAADWPFVPQSGDPQRWIPASREERSMGLDCNETSTECTVAVDSARRIPMLNIATPKPLHRARLCRTTPAPTI